MAKKRNIERKHEVFSIKGIIEGAGKVVEQKIVNTIEQNYMPYAMSVILSRAIPEIDGFKPSHRKLLYTMYKMGLLDKVRTKSANIVGQTMKLNPHGDSAIYDTMVRLSKGYEALLHPYVDSKGNFGKFYSRDMAWAASRYTEAKLDEICTELFQDIGKNTVDFVPNYDNTLKEPTLLPAKFPSILVNANTGIAVGMASSICPFNLKEVCNTTIKILKGEDFSLKDTLLAPDFPGGGNIIYDEKIIENIYKTGRGSIKVRSRYTYDKDSNCIDISSIPPTTTTEAIIEKIIDLVKKGSLKEISDVRDETGIDGLKITIDLKRNANVDKLMKKLFKFTTLEDSFSCNFNVLVDGKPKVFGVYELLLAWIDFRKKCVVRKTEFDLKKKQDKLHLLKALKVILLDIDKAIEIIKNTKEESNVVPNLIKGFSIDEIQAEYVAEIKLRQLNKEYLLRRIDDIKILEEDIKNLKEILADEILVKKIIIEELEEIAEKYGKPRNTMLIYADDIDDSEVIDEVLDYPVNIFFTKQGYFKKITMQSLRMNSEQKLKEEDKVIEQIETHNDSSLIFFTNKCNAYKAKVSDFQDTKASILGDFIPVKLGMGEDEIPIYMVNTDDYSGFMLFFFANGKVAKVSLKSYETKTNRKKLVNVYYSNSELISMYFSKEAEEYLMTTSVGKMFILNSDSVSLKVTRDTQGVCVMTLGKGQRVVSVKKFNGGDIVNSDRYRTKTIPVKGFFPEKNIDQVDQLKL